MLDGLRVSKFPAKFQFWMNYIFLFFQWDYKTTYFSLLKLHETSYC